MAGVNIKINGGSPTLIAAHAKAVRQESRLSLKNKSPVFKQEIRFSLPCLTAFHGGRDPRISSWPSSCRIRLPCSLRHTAPPQRSSICSVHRPDSLRFSVFGHSTVSRYAASFVCGTSMASEDFVSSICTAGMGSGSTVRSACAFPAISVLRVSFSGSTAMISGLSVSSVCGTSMASGDSVSSACTSGTASVSNHWSVCASSGASVLSGGSSCTGLAASKFVNASVSGSAVASGSAAGRIRI